MFAHHCFQIKKVDLNLTGFFDPASFLPVFLLPGFHE